jgi:hypothetical protein
MMVSDKAYAAPTLDALSLQATSDELQPVGPSHTTGDGIGVGVHVGVNLGLPGLGS